jgi:hypothetical protein
MPTFVPGSVCMTADYIAELSNEIVRLRSAIETHRAQKADDRCILDDDELYAVLGDGIKCDRRVGDKAAMLHNCERFIERRCEGGGWPTYVELEQKVAELMKENAELRGRIAHLHYLATMDFD